MTDAVVIGAGPNGLAAAIRLAEAGRSVLVLEAADAPGGAVRTQELTLPGFLHDTFSSVYPASVASPVFARMPLEVEWVHPDACYAHPLPGGEAALLYRDRAALPGGDAERWAEFSAPFLERFTALRDTMLSGFPPLGGPLRLGAFSVGEVRGDHFVLATAGYLHQVFRLPDLIGGPLLVGGWLETGSAFNSGDEFALDTQVSAGIIAETLIGPVFGAVSVGFDGSNRFYLGIGRIFR